MRAAKCASAKSFTIRVGKFLEGQVGARPRPAAISRSRSVRAASTRRLYEALTLALAASACPHLLRVWSVIPELNMREDLTPPSAPDHERYRQFCLGRHEGLLPRLECERLPAASAIGSRGEGF